MLQTQKCGEMEMQNGQSHIHLWRIKIRRDTSGARDPSPTQDHPAQGSSARKISPHNFWGQKPGGVGEVGRNCGKKKKIKTITIKWQ